MASAALALDTGRVKLVTQATRAPRASKLSKLTEELRELTKAVELGWEEMPYSVQVAFREIAHYLEDPPRRGIWDRLKFTYTFFRAGPEAFTDYMDAVIKFRDALLDTLAREQQAFDQMMRDETLLASVEQGWEDLESGNTISLKEAIQCLERD